MKYFLDSSILIMMRAHPSLLRIVTMSLVIYTLTNAASADNPSLFIEKAHRFFDDAKYDSAISNFERGGRLYVNTQDFVKIIDATNWIAESYRVMNNTKQSLQWLDSAYSLIRHLSPKPSEQLAKALEIHGRVLDYNLRQFDNAKVYYDSSLAIRKSLYGTEHLTISENIFLLGRIDFFTGQLEQASEKYLQAVDMKLKLGGENEISLFDPYQSLGALNRRQLKMDESLKYYQKAEAVWANNRRPVDHPSYAMMVYGLGNLNIETGMYEDAKQSYRNAVTTFEKFFGANDFRVGSTYSNIAACYRNQLEFANAEQYYLKAKSIYESALPENHPFITANCVDLADMYHLFGYLDESAKYSGRAIALMEKYQEKKGNRDLALANMYYATNLSDLKRLPEASERIKTAIGIFESIDEQHLTSNAYTISGKINSLSGNNDLASLHYLKAINLFGDTSKRTLQLGYNLRSYAAFLNETGSPAKAYPLFNKSLYHLNVDILQNGELKQLNDFQNVDHLIELLPDRGKTLLALYEQTGDTKYLGFALNNYTFLTDLYERVIKESKSERSKLLQVPNLAAYYEKAVRCALELAEKTGDVKYRDKAFAFAEQSKAVVLWQYVHDSRSRKFAGIPGEITDHERRLKEKLSFIETSMDTSAVAKSKYMSLRSSYDSLVTSLEKNYPTYYDLKYRRPQTDVAVLTAQLRSNESILEYLAGDDNIYAFVITKQGLQVFTFSNEPAIDTIASDIRRALASFDTDGFNANTKKFYDNYFGRIDHSLQEKNITSITVISDGPISYIPLEALVRRGANDYLVNYYTFHYQYSAGLIPTYAAIAGENSNKDFIGFAPTFGGSDNEEKLASLDFTTEEVGDITGLFHGKSLVGDDATETNFKKMVKDYGIIHVATHAVMDDHDAARSRLHFSPKDTIEDGKLHAWELFNMQINASLVTLSACNTGAGKIHKGEGVMSLSRAFAYAGCPSIVTSLWQAQDRSTATLMHKFYEFLSKGMNKSEALRLAKLDYLTHADKVKTFPFFWAGFILVGDDSPLKQNNYWLWVAAGLGGISAIVMIAYFRSSRRLAARSR